MLDSYETFKLHMQKNDWGFHNGEFAAFSFLSWVDAKQIEDWKEMKCNKDCPFCNPDYFDGMFSTKDDGGWCTLLNGFIIRGSDKCGVIKDAENYIKYNEEQKKCSAKSL